MKVYIAGPMTGKPLWNFPAFDRMRDWLTLQGHKPISPADMDREVGFSEERQTLAGFDMQAARDRDIAAIKECDAVMMLDGWQNSVGATAEYCLARWFGNPKDGEAEDVLEEALRLTTGDRNNQYGPPTQDFQKTATMWGAILGCEVEPKDVALCMIALKLSRATWSDKRDHYVDIAGYARCGWLCVEDKKKEVK